MATLSIMVKLDALIKIRCSSAEKARVTKLAGKAKMTLSDFIRVRLEASR